MAKARSEMIKCKCYVFTSGLLSGVQNDKPNAHAPEEVRATRQCANYISRRDRTLAGTIEALCASANLTTLPRALQLAASANSVRSNNVQLALFEALLKMFERLVKDHPGFGQHVPAQVGTSLVSLIFDPRYNDLSEALRLKRSRMIVAVAQVAGLVQSALRERLPGEIESEKSPPVRQELERAYKALA